MSWFTTYRGRVESSDLDRLGHMNVQHYMGRISLAGFAVMEKIGLGETAFGGRYGLSMLRCEIDFRRELTSGEQLRLETRMLTVGTKSLTFRHRLLVEPSGDLAMEAKIVAVCIDLEERKSMALPEAVAVTARGLIGV
ncbi:MAG: acyl-CoA thioesterase [Alphaproteobacteria bacterium]|nr:acyl-CoA thioesterase [Alphaproteobacteria bacterium]